MNNKILLIADEFVKKFNLVSNEVKWSDIVKLFEFDSKRELKIAPHIKKRDIQVGDYDKMKVAPARAVPSQATAHSFRQVVIDYPNEFGKDVLTTALFCDMVGRWDTLVNNLRRKMAFHANKKEKNAESWAFLEEFKKFYITMKLHKDQKATEFKPTQWGVIMTHNSLKHLEQNLLNECGFEYFLTAKTNNDLIEGFHGDERALQKNPTAKQFKDNAKMISVSHFMGHVKNANCENDEDTSFMTSLKELSEMKKKGGGN